MPPKRFYKKRTYDEANAGNGTASVNTTDSPQIQFDLGLEKKKVTVRKFKNMKLVDIREYYQKENNWLPGSKGISLTEEQWNVLMAKMIDINEALHKLDDKSELDVLKAALESKEKLAKVKQEEAAAAAAASAIASQTKMLAQGNGEDEDDEDVDGVEFEDVSLAPGEVKHES